MIVCVYACDSASCARTMSLMLMYATVANGAVDGLVRALPWGSESAAATCSQSAL